MRIGNRLTPKLLAGEAGTNNETEISYGRVSWQYGVHRVYGYVSALDREGRTIPSRLAYRE